MSINPDDMETRLKAIEVEVFDNGKAYWMERASRAEALVERMMTDPPALMSTPLGLLPIDAEGMRRLGDALGKAQRLAYARGYTDGHTEGRAEAEEECRT